MKSAKQIYGDDFTVFQTSEGNEDEQAAISLIADKKKRKGEGDRSEQRKKGPVYFEKSQTDMSERSKTKGTSFKELNKLRNIAESQIAKAETETIPKPTLNPSNDNNETNTRFTPVSKHPAGNNAYPINVYSRQSVRTLDQTSPKPEVKEKRVPEKNVPEKIIPEKKIPEEIIPEEKIPEEIIPEKKTPEKKEPEKQPEPFRKPRRTRGLLSRFDESKPTIDNPEAKKSSFKQSETHSHKDNREAKKRSFKPSKTDSDNDNPEVKKTSFKQAHRIRQNDNPEVKKRAFKQAHTVSHNEDSVEELHQRFDKLEALFHSELISVNHEYVSHPVFQQLVDTGIPSSIVSEWFKRIVDKNIDPFNHSETFAFEISKILKKALISNRRKDPGKYQLFIGFSGSGKTTLIMKLILNQDPFQRKKTAVLSVLPDRSKQKNYFTIMQPFCIENEVHYYKAGMDSDLTEMSQDLKKYEQIFIDTPSLAVDRNKAETEFQKIKQLLGPLPDIDTLLTVNMAGNYNDSQNLLTDPGAVSADFIALTHLDEIEEWGPIIPLFEKTKCSGSYFSIGNSITESLKSFDAAWLTKNVLEKTD